MGLTATLLAHTHHSTTPVHKPCPTLHGSLNPCTARLAGATTARSTTRRLNLSTTCMFERTALGGTPRQPCAREARQPRPLRFAPCTHLAPGSSTAPSPCERITGESVLDKLCHNAMPCKHVPLRWLWQPPARLFLPLAPPARPLAVVLGPLGRASPARLQARCPFACNYSRQGGSVDR